MARVAMGQSKMSARPVAGLMHLFVYIGFILINIEVLEIILDGIFGTHRMFHGVLGDFYFMIINFFEVLAVLVIVGVSVFFYRLGSDLLDYTQKYLREKEEAMEFQKNGDGTLQ